MAMSYSSESEAPRDFRVSSIDIENDGHYSKCMLCYTAKKNFYCSECIRNGNFIHSSMRYTDRYSEKQAKLLQLRHNRQLALNRCDKFLVDKLKKDKLVTETKKARDSLDILRLAIQQRRSNIDSLKKDLANLVSYNSELRVKLPRYRKRVSNLDKHSQMQRVELQNTISLYNDQAQFLAALRRSRIRQLNRYIFPVYISYDTSDSIEDLEFVGENAEEEPPQRPQLHIVAPWIDVDCDYGQFQAWMRAAGAGGGAGGGAAEGAGAGAGAGEAAHRRAAALALAAQLTALLAWTLDVRLPQPLCLSEYSEGRGCGGWRGCATRARGAAAALCARAGLPPQPPLAGLAALAAAAAADLPALGRVEGGVSAEAAAAWAAHWPEPEPDEPDPPEHLTWPDPQVEEAAPSLVTSAAASLVSLLRGWAK